MDEEVKQVHPSLVESFPKLGFRDLLEDFFIALLTDVRRVREQDIKTVSVVKDFREVNLEIENLLPICQLLNQLIDFTL